MSASPDILTPSPASSDHGHSSSPAPSPSNAPLSALSQLSRNTSVLSSSSSSSSLSLSSPSSPQPPISSIPPSPRLPPLRRPPQMHLQFGTPHGAWASAPRSPHGTPPTTPRGDDRSPLFGVPRDILPASHSQERFDRRHMSIASAASTDTASTLRPSSRNSTTGERLGMSPRDFQFGRELGRGSYSVVTAAYLPHNGQTYAVKALDKAHVTRYKAQGNKVDVQNERKALMKLSRPGHPGVVRLFWAMQDQSTLYFVLELCPKGDMTTVLRRLGSFSIACARFYFAQIVDALCFIHSHGVIHRDLKPDNFLFTDEWRIKIADFGAAKLVEQSDGKETPASSQRSSFVGSPQYVSPEILAHHPVSYPTDLWSLGIILYQLITGHFPFDNGPSGGMAHYLMWQRVLKGEYTFSDDWDADARDLVARLLVSDPAGRIGAVGGAEGARELRAHPFFAPLDWPSLWTCEAPQFEPGMYRREKRAGEPAWLDEDAWDAMLDRVDSEDEMEDAEDAEDAGEEEEEGEVEPADADANAPPTPRAAAPPRPPRPAASTSTPSSSSSSSSASSIPSLSTSRRTSATAATSVSPAHSVPPHSQPPPQPEAGAEKEAEKDSERTLLAGPVLVRSILGAWTTDRQLVLTDRRLMLLKGDKARVEIALAAQPRGQGQGQGQAADDSDVWAEARGPKMLVVHKGQKKWEFMFSTLPPAPTGTASTGTPAPSADRWAREILSAVAGASASAAAGLPGVRVYTPSTLSASTSRSGSVRGSASALSSRRSSRSRPGGGGAGEREKLAEGMQGMSLGEHV